MQAYRHEVGEGIYCTPEIEEAEYYAGEFKIKGKAYKTVIQCRVHRDHIRECNEGKYWVINNP